MPATSDWQNDGTTSRRGEPAFEFDEQGRKVLTKSSSGKMMQFAVVMVCAGALLALVIGALMPAPIQSPAALAGAPRLNLTTPGKSPAKGVPNLLQYRADASGHFFVDAAVNGTMIRFLVDTGATAVALNPDDARAAGISDSTLRFSQSVNTANGETHAAPTTLRSVRIDQLDVPDVPALVMEQPMAVSLLGMSFLSRLNSYSIRDGVLTIEW